jgi:hypothetical protein
MGWPLQPDLLIQIRLDEHAHLVARRARERETHRGQPQATAPRSTLPTAGARTTAPIHATPTQGAA